MSSRWERLAQAIGLRRARVETPQLDLASTEMLAHVAHEARQPLSAARLAFQIIRACPHDERCERACVVLERQFARLSQLMDDLLEASRLQLGLRALRLEHIDLVTVISEVADSMALQAEEKRQHLDTELPGDPVWIDADSRRIQQVASNLLVNGIRYTDPGGRLSVRLTRGANEAVLKIADTGCGITRDLLPYLFQPFTKGDAASEGLGVGLAIAREIVELHGGTIRASSPGPGRGSEFVVSLPICASEHEAGDAHIEQGRRSPPSSIRTIS